MNVLAGISGPQTARITRVVDGDTFHCDIEVGRLNIGEEVFSVWTLDRPVRLDKCNAWEHNTVAGQAAKANLVSLLPVGTLVTLSNVTGYKYGARGELRADVAVGGIDLVGVLVSQQWLAPWNGVGKATDHLPPWPRTV